MILTERFLLPPNIDDAQRRAIVDKRVRKRRGINGRASGHIIAVFPGEDGWVRQLGNENGAIYFDVIKRQVDPRIPQSNSRRKCW
jgi:hypothetical protein